MSAAVERLLCAVNAAEPADLDYAVVQAYEDRLASLVRWDRMRAYGSTHDLDGGPDGSA